MKKIILLFVALAAHISFAQNTFPALGNVGIGTEYPTSSLEIIELSDSRPEGQSAPTKSILKLSRTGTGNYSWPESAEFRIGHGGNSIFGSKLDLYIKGSTNTSSPPDQHVMTWNYNGNVGIGTDNPDAKLVVNGDAKVKQNLFISGASGGYTTGDNPVLYFGVNNDFAKISVPFGDKMILSSYHGYTFNTSYNGSTALPAMTIGITGNVGIGTTNPINKLDVNGTIHSKEVKVDMLGWSDFVFKKEYSLPTLEEVEKHIAEKGHLENIPSEKEVLENGIKLGEMNTKLLQKIEELTLYMIEMKKDITTLKQENKELKTQILKN